MSVTRGAFHGDVGAGAHGDADLRLREGRRVVDAVARHGDDAALGLNFLTARGFLLRQHLGDDFVDAELARDRVGRGAAVAGQHDDAHAALRGVPSMRRSRSSLIGSATAMRPASRAVDGDEASRV